MPKSMNAHSIPSLLYSSCSSTNIWWLKNCCNFSLVKLIHSCSKPLYCLSKTLGFFFDDVGCSKNVLYHRIVFHLVFLFFIVFVKWNEKWGVMKPGRKGLANCHLKRQIPAGTMQNCNDVKANSSIVTKNYIKKGQDIRNQTWKENSGRVQALDKNLLTQARALLLLFYFAGCIRQWSNRIRPHSLFLLLAVFNTFSISSIHASRSMPKSMNDHSIPSRVYSSCSRTNMWWLKNCWSFSLVKLMQSCSKLLNCSIKGRDSRSIYCFILVFFAITHWISYYWIFFTRLLIHFLFVWWILYFSPTFIWVFFALRSPIVFVTLLSW